MFNSGMIGPRLGAISETLDSATGEAGWVVDTTAAAMGGVDHLLNQLVDVGTTVKTVEGYMGKVGLSGLELHNGLDECASSLYTLLGIGDEQGGTNNPNAVSAYAATDRAALLAEDIQQQHVLACHELHDLKGLLVAAMEKAGALAVTLEKIDRVAGGVNGCAGQANLAHTKLDTYLGQHPLGEI